MFTIKEILEATGGDLIAGGRANEVNGVSIDSRTIKPGELFVAIIGDRFNGHNFIEQAIQRQAAAVLLCEPGGNGRDLSRCGISVVKVGDTVDALGKLAHYHRRRFTLPVIAITGSSGKTTTKEMTRAVLARRFNVLYNLGTQNNHIGVPLTLLRLSKEHNAAVIEIGANHKGEIA
ncbi:MAG: UDP-N-acetylmuramoyl-tripeptide--D-alanyl-D-alanine ligase, partial [Candidatus Omnitrophota bacterium]